ncbi:hypothetical protein PTKIN_Ptkin06aG0068800 [Pterospermum kingtungense]
MNASTKLGIALIAIFATCVLAIIIELVYVLWRKRRFRQRSVVYGGTRSIDSDFSNSSPNFYSAPSKELLYFFCWKNQPTRVEPSSGVVVSSTPTDATTAVGSETATMEEDDDELAKWQAMYGPSRVLYTIKEEEREGADSAGDSADQSEAKTEKRDSLRDCFSGPIKMAEDVAVDVEEATPFSTPCASPPYFTPSPSPGRDVRVLISWPVNDDVSSPGKVGLVNLRIEG